MNLYDDILRAFVSDLEKEAAEVPWGTKGPKLTGRPEVPGVRQQWGPLGGVRAQPLANTQGLTPSLARTRTAAQTTALKGVKAPAAGAVRVTGATRGLAGGKAVASTGKKVLRKVVGRAIRIAA